MEAFEPRKREESQLAGTATSPAAMAAETAETAAEIEYKEQVSSMGRDSISQLLLRFSLPATIAMAVMASYNIIDTMFVSRLGSEAIAALSVSFPIQMIIGALGIGTGIGAASLISRSLGAGRHEEASRAVGQVFFLSLAVGIAVTIPGLIFLHPLLLAFGATPDILDLTAEYMSVIIIGTFFLMVMMMLNNVTRAEGNAMLSMRVMIISAVANIIMDPIFIFTLGMEIRGAAVATILAKVLGMGLLLHYYIKGHSALSLRLSHLKPSFRDHGDLPHRSAYHDHSNGRQLLPDPGKPFPGGFGYIPIAVMGLIMRFQNFTLMPVAGISQGLLPIIGFNYGRINRCASVKPC